jgi:hypothetical protein
MPTDTETPEIAKGYRALPYSYKTSAGGINIYLFFGRETKKRAPKRHPNSQSQSQPPTLRTPLMKPKLF